MAVVYYPKQSVLFKRDTVSASFEQVVLNTTPNTIFYFGSSSISEISGSTIYITASNALTASFISGFIESASFASFALSSSWAPSSQTVSSISSSWASSSVSSSYATTALNVLNGVNSASYALSASYSPFNQTYQTNTISSSYASSSLTASFLTAGTYQITSSWVVNLPSHTSSWSGNSIVSNTTLYASQSQWSVSASYASSSTTAATATNLGLTAYNISVTQASQSRLSITSSYASSSVSSSYSLTASYALNGGSSGTTLTSGSFYPITSSWSLSSSYAPFTQTYQTNTISSSYASSSTTSETATELSKTAYDISVTHASQSRWATSASFASSSLSASYSLTSSFLTKDRTYEVTSSWAISASYAPGSPSISASYALTASYALNGGSGGATLTSGSFYPITSSWAESASYYPPQLYQLDTISASYSSGSLSSSYAITSLTSLSASYAPGSPSISSSYSLTSSYTSFSGKPNGYVSVWQNNELSATSSIRENTGSVSIGNALFVDSIGNIGLGRPTSGSAPLLALYRAGASFPVMRLEDGDITIPNYTTVGFVSGLITPNTVATMGSLGSSIGGMSFNAFSNTSDERVINFAAYSGKTTVTTPPLTFTVWKHDGSTSRTVLSNTEPAIDFNNGTNYMLRLYTSSSVFPGSVGIGVTSPQAALHVRGPVSASAFGSGSLHGTASYSLAALSASYAPGSPAESASYALTASYALNGGAGGTTLTTGSFYPITSSWAESASYVFNTGYTVVTWPHSSMSLDMSYNKTYVRLTHATSCSITVESQSVVPWTDNVDIAFRVAGAGYPAIVTSSGVTVNNGDLATTFVQHNNFALKRISQDVWDLI